ncbi:MAG: rhomboid family intramembrane serine protease [Candidatus Woesearchaeota archaeon]|jgi:membrane associated rhomboid family serine protease|nr:rhomboid family intramembrane serine protease [Candidatus Woesearchaeota archaeon]
MVEYVSIDDVEKKVSVKDNIKSSMNISYILPLISINVLLFVLGEIYPFIFENLVLVPALIFSKPWTLLTTVFMHASISHLLYNMIALFFFGAFLERRIGPKKFISMYLIIGVLVSFIAIFFYAPNSILLGASGAIMGVIGALIVLNPQAKVLLYFIIPMKLWVLGILWFALDFFGLFYDTGVANFAHMIGMFFGLAYGLYLHKKRNKYFKKFKMKKEVKADDTKDYIKQVK